MSASAQWAPHLPEFRADPYPFYAALRETDPVHRVDDWTVVLTRFDDVHRVLRDPGYSRDIETSISIEYLSRLYQEYEVFIEEISRLIPVIRVPWDQFRNVEEIAAAIEKEYRETSFLRKVVKWGV